MMHFFLANERIKQDKPINCVDKRNLYGRYGLLLLVDCTVYTICV